MNSIEYHVSEQQFTKIKRIKLYLKNYVNVHEREHFKIPGE